MNYRNKLLPIICLLLLSCSSPAKNSFVKIVSGVDKYFSEKPYLLTSKTVLKNGEKVYVYYALKIADHSISYNIKKTFSSDTSYTAFLNVSCRVLDNSSGGDILADAPDFQKELRISSVLARGFSTTQMALADNNFSQYSKSLNIIISYSYHNGKWICTNIAGGGISKVFVRDLKTFPQNKKFRQTIGMEG